VQLSFHIVNRVHFDIEAGGYIFPARTATKIRIEDTSSAFKAIRSHPNLKYYSDALRAKAEVARVCTVAGQANQYNMVYDTQGQHRRSNYVRVIEALGKPIAKHLPPGSCVFIDRPGSGINVRFFSSRRMKDLGKDPVGPWDVFYSHGIGDKDYWLAPYISQFNYAMVPGPAWAERIKKGGYAGSLFVVGYTKLDPLFQGEYEHKPHSKPYVVWAPTHGYGAHSLRGRSSYPACLQLFPQIPDKYDKTLALHPATRATHRQAQDVTLQELYDADVVIADAGSTLYEAWALGKPVIFPDWLCKHDVMAKFKPGNLEYDIYNQGIGYHAKDMKDLLDMVDYAIQHGMQKREVDFMERVFPAELRGKAGETAAAALLSINKRYTQG